MNPPFSWHTQKTNTWGPYNSELHLNIEFTRYLSLKASIGPDPRSVGFNRLSLEFQFLKRGSPVPFWNFYIKFSNDINTSRACRVADAILDMYQAEVARLQFFADSSLKAPQISFSENILNSEEACFVSEKLVHQYGYGLSVLFADVGIGPKSLSREIQEFRNYLKTEGSYYDPYIWASPTVFLQVLKSKDGSFTPDIPSSTVQGSFSDLRGTYAGLDYASDYLLYTSSLTDFAELSLRVNAKTVYPMYPEFDLKPAVATPTEPKKTPMEARFASIDWEDEPETE